MADWKKALLEAWQSGRLCLHPTDTIPGLSFHPALAHAAENLRLVKGRPETKTPLALIGSWSLALRLWEPLPAPWSEVLAKLWPAPLSVIWQASPLCPAGIVAPERTVCLRWPLWGPELSWMAEALETLDEPFPSTSVNQSGEPALIEWESAVNWLQTAKKDADVFIPAGFQPRAPKTGSLPSTLIRIHSAGTFELLRKGALDPALIAEHLRGAQHARNL